MGSRFPSEAEVFHGLVALLADTAVLTPWRTLACRIDRSGPAPIYWILATRKVRALVADALTRFLKRDFHRGDGIWLLPVTDARRIAQLRVIRERAGSDGWQIPAGLAEARGKAARNRKSLKARS